MSSHCFWSQITQLMYLFSITFLFCCYFFPFCKKLRMNTDNSWSWSRRRYLILNRYFKIFQDNSRYLNMFPISVQNKILKVGITTNVKYYILMSFHNFCWWFIIVYSLLWFNPSRKLSTTQPLIYFFIPSWMRGRESEGQNLWHL